MACVRARVCACVRACAADGVVEGYNSVATRQLSSYNLTLLQSVGDLLDLVPALSPQARPDYFSMTPDELAAAVRTSVLALWRCRVLCPPLV
jgi:hypothetical protein